MPPVLFFSHDCFVYSGSFVVPNKFQDCLFYVLIVYSIPKCHWNFDWDVLSLQMALGCMDILTILTLLIHEYGMSFHLFVSSLMSFSKVLQFSLYRSFTSLVKFISRYITGFDAVVNGIVYFSQMFHCQCIEMQLIFFLEF